MFFITCRWVVDVATTLIWNYQIWHWCLIIVLPKLSEIHSNIFTIVVVYDQNNMKMFYVSMTSSLFLSLTNTYNNWLLKQKKAQNKLYRQFVSMEWEFWTNCTSPILFLLDLGKHKLFFFFSFSVFPTYCWKAQMPFIPIKVILVSFYNNIN